MAMKGDLIALAYRGIENSDYDGSTAKEAIIESDDYYFGRLPGAAVEGRSQSVSMDVQNVVTAQLGSIMESVSSDSFLQFTPMGDGDDSASELESKATNSAIDEADGYMVKLAAVDSCLRYTNGLIRVWVDDTPETVSQRLVDANESEANQVAAQFPDEFKADIEPLKPTGFKITIQKPSSKLRLEAVDLARLILRKDYPSIDISEADFVGLEREETRAELKSMGFSADIVDKLPEGKEFFTEGAIRSKLVAEEVSYTDKPDRDMDLITFYECWIKLKGERHRVVVSNRKLLDESIATHIPLVLGAAFPQGTRYSGISLASKIIPYQVSKTEILRQSEDNLSVGNVPSASAYDMNLDDLTDGRIGGIKRMNSPNSRYEPVPVQDLGPASLTMLAYQDQMRSEAGGGALDAESTDSQMMQSQIGAVASQQVLMNQELRSIFAAKNIANTLFRPLFRLVHRALREDFNGQMTVRMNDQFVPVNPSSWQPRTLISTPSGLSPSQRNREAANLTTVMQLQQQLQQSGVPMVTPDGVHAAIQAWGNSTGLPTNQFFTDPQSETGQQLAQQQGQQAEQQQQMAAQIEQIPAQIAQMKEQASTERNTQDNEVKLKIAGIQAELDEAKLVLEGIENQQNRDAADADETSEAN